MLGDWVYTTFIDGKTLVPVQVIQIYGTTIGFQGNDYSGTTDEIEPILLTDKILTKNGLSNTDDVTIEHSDLHDCYYIDLWDNIYTAYPKIRAIVKYVHELQHILKFAGFDKEIEL